MRFRFLKLQNKFFFTFICLSLIPILIFTVFTTNLYVNSVKEQIDANALIQLRSIDATIYEKTKNVKRFVDIIKMNPVVTKEFTKENPNQVLIDAEMRNAILTCDGIAGTVFLFPTNEYYSFNLDGLQLDTIRLQLLFNISNLHPNSFTWFDKSSDNRDVGIADNLITVGTLYEYIDHNGINQIAKVYIFVDKELFNQILTSFPDASVTITDKSGSYITSNYSDEHFPYVSNNFKVLRRIYETQEGVFSFRNKKNYSTAIYTSNTTDFKYVSIMPSDNFYKNARAITLVALFIILMFIFLLILLYTFIIKRITLPIKSIADTMKDFDDSSLGIRLPVKGNDEASVIAMGYNKMMERFNEILEEIKEQKSIQKDTEIKALSYQINPHFLYNALSAIRIEASNNNDEKVADNILFLSKILKSVFSNTNKYITLEEELEISGYVVNLLELRYDKPISYKVSYDEELRYLKIPSMVLQPIIENAVLHGLSKKMDLEDFQAKIDVMVQKENGDLIIRIIDNGVGMDDDTLKAVFDKSNSQKKGVGLFNVDERIKLYFGDDYGLCVKSKPGIYTEVEMKLKFL